MADVPRSQLPQDTGYWEILAQRIRVDASGPLAAYAAIHDSWYGLLARRSTWLISASAAGMLILWLSLPTADSSAALRWIEKSVAPNEIAGALIGGEAPPSVNALMVQFPPAQVIEGKP